MKQKTYHIFKSVQQFTNIELVKVYDHDVQDWVLKIKEADHENNFIKSDQAKSVFNKTDFDTVV